MRLLLVEDNLELAVWLGKTLRQENYAVDIVHGGEEAGHTLAVGEYALVILDLALPKRDGLEVLRDLRASGNRVPVIVLTANAGLNGRVTGLNEWCGRLSGQTLPDRGAGGTHPCTAAPRQRPLGAGRHPRRVRL